MQTKPQKRQTLISRVFDKARISFYGQLVIYENPSAKQLGENLSMK